MPTQICVSLGQEKIRQVVERMGELAPLADLFEVRGDRIADLDLLAILRAKTTPLIFACRSVEQGGHFDLPAERRHNLLLEAVKRGFDYVDVELSSKFLDVMMEKAGGGLIVSHHDFIGMPDDLDLLYAEMSEKGADIVKIAVTPRSFADVGRLIEFAQRTSASGGPGLVAVGLGPLGAPTRLLAGRWNAPFTFASAVVGEETAPGQIDVAKMADLYRVREVGPDTKVYGVLGRDVTRSLSPVLHNRAFEARGVDAIYVPLPAESLDAFFEALPALDLSGFSVTRPYKTEILSRLQEVDETAALCGSVNTVLVHDGLLMGSTTDGMGISIPLRKRTELKGKMAVILGAGGAARAAALSLVRKGLQVIVLARDADKAAFAAGAVGCSSGALDEIRTLSWDILINATPLGGLGFEQETPVPADAHHEGSVVLDMVYDPIDTRFLREAAAAGCTTIHGLEMLLEQAIPQFETWTGKEAPAEALRALVDLLAAGHR
ncbi:MAG: shikimate dehydrogenase [Vicinamibacteria bacterium]|nr:shikimate dehydrogenase [Vicinamibacteria bacterium]